MDGPRLSGVFGIKLQQSRVSLAELACKVYGLYICNFVCRHRHTSVCVFIPPGTNIIYHLQTCIYALSIQIYIHIHMHMLCIGINVFIYIYTRMYIPPQQCTRWDLGSRYHGRPASQDSYAGRARNAEPVFSAEPTILPRPQSALSREVHVILSYSLGVPTCFLFGCHSLDILTKTIHTKPKRNHIGKSRSFKKGSRRMTGLHEI